MNEEEIRNLLHEMRQTDVPVDSVARVRLKLARRIRERPQRRIAAWVMAAAGVLLGVIFFNPTPKTDRQASRAIAAPDRPYTPPIHVTEEIAPRPKVDRATRRERQPKHTSAAVTIRIETPDPEVVILLIGGL
jgi:hypothetical protein